MTDKKISELTLTSTVETGDDIPINRSGTNYRIKPTLSDDGTDLTVNPNTRNFSLGTGGLKDANVTTAIKLGDATNTSFTTENKTITGSVNWFDVFVDMNMGSNVAGDDSTDFFITDAGGGTVDISAGKGFIKTTDSITGDIIAFDYAGQTGVAVPNDNATNWVYIDYNAGSPQVAFETSSNNINFNTEIVLGRVYRVGTDLTIWNVGQRFSNYRTKDCRKGFELYGAQRASGLVLSETGTRNIKSEAGVIYCAHNRSSVLEIDTNVAGSFDVFNSSASVTPDATGATQVDNTNYWNGAALTALTVNRYGTRFFYRSFDGSLYMQYGTSNTTSTANAESEAVPTPPVFLRDFGIYIGRVVIQQGEATFSAVSNPFITPEFGALVSSHTDLADLTFASSGHTGTANTVAGFDNTGVATNYTLQYANDYYADSNSTATNPDGTIKKPYASLQALLTAIGTPVDVADARRHINIHLTGQFDEAISFPQQRMWTVRCHGTVVIGDGVADNLYNSTTPRNVTVLNTATGEHVGSPSRPMFAIRSWSSEESSTHSAYGAGNLIISGDLQFNHVDGNTTTHETYLQGVKVQGDVTANANEAGSVHNIIVEKCFFDNTFNLGNANINIARSTEFDGLITATGVGRFVECEISGGLTASQVNNYPPSGFLGTEINGGTLTITGMRVDNVTRKFIIDNAIAVVGSLINIDSTLVDSEFKIVDETDNTKTAQFQASGITTGTTRTLTVQDADGTIAYLSDITGSTGLSNGYIDGLIMSNDTDADHDIAISTGVCKSDDKTTDISLSAIITKRIDASWAVGDDAGGLPATRTLTGTFTSVGTAVTGSGTSFTTEFEVGDILFSSSNAEARKIETITDNTNIVLSTAYSVDVSVAENVQINGLAPNAWYHVHVIEDGAGTVDAGFDTRVDAAELLNDSTYTKYRRIGSVQTDASSNILGFRQDGDYVFYDIPITDFSSTSLSTTKTDIDISVPPVPVISILNLTLLKSATLFIKVFQFNEEDAIPAIGDRTIGLSVSSTQKDLEAQRFTNDQKISYRSTDTTAILFSIITMGYIDFRGKQ